MSMVLHYDPMLLALRHPFRIATGMRTHTNAVLTRIHYGDLTGYGEAAMPPYYGENHDTATAFLTKAAGVIRMLSADFHPADVMPVIDQLDTGNHAAKAAVDLALHDLWAKIQGKPLATLLGIQPDMMPETSFTLGIDTPEVLAEKLASAHEFNIIKVKLGTDDDRSIIRTIRNLSNKPIYADANQGWTDKQEALDLIYWLQSEGVVMIEQPVPKQDLTSASWLTERSPLPIIADEAFQRHRDLDTVSSCFHGVNIKLMKCTGIAEALRVAQDARNKGLQLMIGCMTETSCGILAAAHIAPLCDFADIDGCWLISNNPFEMPQLEKGRVVLPADQTGLGVALRK